MLFLYQNRHFSNLFKFDPICCTTMHNNGMYFRWKTLFTMKSFGPQFFYYLNIMYVHSQLYPICIKVITVISVKTIVSFGPKFTCLKFGLFWRNFLDHDSQECLVFDMKNIIYTEILWTTVFLLFEHELCSLTTLSHVYLGIYSHFSKHHCYFWS